MIYTLTSNGGLVNSGQSPLLLEALDNEIKTEIPENIYKEIEIHWAKNAILELLKKGIYPNLCDANVDSRVNSIDFAILGLYLIGALKNYKLFIRFMGTTY